MARITLLPTASLAAENRDAHRPAAPEHFGQQGESVSPLASGHGSAALASDAGHGALHMAAVVLCTTAAVTAAAAGFHCNVQYTAIIIG